MWRIFIQRSAFQRTYSTSSTDTCSVHRGGTVVLFQSLIHDQAALAKILSHGRTRIGRGVLDVRPVHVVAGEVEVSLNGFKGVLRVPDDQSTDYVHLVLVQPVNGSQRGIAGVVSVVARRVLGGGTQELEVAFQDIFDPQKYVAKPRPMHQGRKRCSVAGDGGSHGLDEVIQLIQPSPDDGVAERFEAMHVERNVVVHEKDGPGTVVTSVADVGQDTLKRVGVEVAAAHLDYRAEATVVGAAARGLDHIHLPAKQR